MTISSILFGGGSSYLSEEAVLRIDRDMKLFGEQCQDREAFNQTTIENLKEISFQIRVETPDDEVLQLAKAFSKRLPSLSFYKGLLDEWNASYVGKKEVVEVYRMLFDNHKLLTALMTDEEMATPVLEIAPFVANNETLDFLYQNSKADWRKGIVEYCFDIRKGHFKEALNIMKNPKNFKNCLEAQSLCTATILNNKVRGDVPILFLRAVCRFCEPKSDRFNPRKTCEASIDEDSKDFMLCANWIQDKDLKAFVLQCAKWAKQKTEAYHQHLKEVCPGIYFGKPEGFEFDYFTSEIAWDFLRLNSQYIP